MGISISIKTQEFEFKLHAYYSFYPGYLSRWMTKGRLLKSNLELSSMLRPSL